jgi:hypothetical protein
VPSPRCLACPRASWLRCPPSQFQARDVPPGASIGRRSGIDLVAQGETPADDSEAARALIASWAEAGCTWWLETRWEMPHGAAERMRQVRERLAAGSPLPCVASAQSHGKPPSRAAAGRGSGRTPATACSGGPRLNHGATIKKSWAPWSRRQPRARFHGQRGW